MSEDAASVTNVSKRYDDAGRTVTALADVTLAIARGTFTLLMGPSGSGKTTLLTVLGGLATPTEGDARLAGRSLVAMREHHRVAHRREHVGFVFQELALVPSMTLLDNVLLPLVPRGITRADRERATALLGHLGLESLADRRADRLSGGERQRGAIARALVHDPEVLLLDEPTAHVDAENAARVLDVLVRLRDEGRTVIASTHDPRVAEDPRVDRVVRMRDGRIVESP